MVLPQIIKYSSELLCYNLLNPVLDTLGSLSVV